jgi:Phosphotransferase enzyme family
VGYPGLVHGDACPDNVRLAGGACRIFDFESSGWGSVALDAAYLLAPFPSCWCFGRLPAEVAAPALAAAVAAWIVARGRALAEALDEDRSWGTTTMRPRLLTWLRSLAARAGVLPRLRALAAELDEVLSRRWPQVRVPEYPALAGPGAVLAQVPEWWQPEA